MPAEIHNLLLTGMSPTGKYKAILTHYLEMGQKQEVLEPLNIHNFFSDTNRTRRKNSDEPVDSLASVCGGRFCPVLISVSQQVWSNSGRVRNINLTALDKHGKVYTDEQFRCFAWSNSENQIVYVAERRHSAKQQYFPQEEFTEGLENERFVYNDNWGEALGDKSVPVLCVLNIETSEVSVLEDIPGHLSPGQVSMMRLEGMSNWRVTTKQEFHGLDQHLADDLFEGANLRSILQIMEEDCGQLYFSTICLKIAVVSHLRDCLECPKELLTSDDQSVSSPRLSPDQTHLLYLEGPVFGPHRHCLKLQLLNWQTKSSHTVVDIVRTAIAGFYGIYSGALSMHCWASDNQRILLSTPQRSRKEVLVVDTKSGSVKSITSGTSEGSWTLLGVQQDLLVVSCSSPNCPPSLKVGVLPPAGSELELQWISVEESSVLPDMEWKILTVDPAMSEKGSPYTDQSFEAILLIPRGSKQGKEALSPLMVSPHGGPHSVFDACWRPTMAGLCRLGFAVLLGSLGFGQDSIDSLISRVGVQDVADTQLAVEAALQMEIYLDPNRIALLGGSHGGFICCHLIGQFPERYKACAVRNSVTNMATLLGTSDIPDWRYASLGLPYSYERIPTEKDLSAMLLSSPIIHAAKVQAPLLLCVGAKDRRVSPYQALEYYRVLKARGIPVQLMWYPEENHALSGVVAEADVFMNCAQWIIHHLSRKID
ncbi:hypothetical protein Chor_011125 [Crotalus horridus]